MPHVVHVVFYHFFLRSMLNISTFGLLAFPKLYVGYCHGGYKVAA